jgi:hypothetical protein
MPASIEPVGLFLGLPGGLPPDQARLSSGLPDRLHVLPPRATEPLLALRLPPGALERLLASRARVPLLLVALGALASGLPPGALNIVCVDADGASSVFSSTSLLIA